MKVILLENVAHVGKKYELAEVKAGYARNFLLAKGLAEPVTKANAKRVAELQHKRAVETEKQQALLDAAVGKLKGVSVTVARKASEGGHLYAAIAKEEISRLIMESFGTEIPEEHIHLEHPVKSLGDHTIVVKVGESMTELTLTVTEEK